MKVQFDNALDFLKKQDIAGAITGSCMLGYMEGEKQDIDVFTYNEAAFTKLIYSLYHNKMFLLLEPMEQWKFKDWTENPYKGSLKKLGLVSIKFKYNMLIDVNIIFKEKNHTIFDVLSSFDMDIICKGIDIQSGKILDLSENNGEKVATWNKWNKSFYNPNIWAVSRILRQFGRVIKYQKRGYNTDAMTHKYIEILQGMIEYENIFTSDKVDEKVLNVKTNSKILITILNQWLATHSITEDEILLIESTIKNL